MVYLIHLERSASDVRHCIGLLEGAHEPLKLYYLQTNTPLFQSLLTPDAVWTVVRLWYEPTRRRFPWSWRVREKANFCPVCGAKL